MATESESVTLMEITVGDYYHGLDQWLRRFRGMNLARWKLLQNTAISLLVAWLVLEAGADLTVSVIVIAVINGISIADLASIWGMSTKLQGKESPEGLDHNEKQKMKNESIENDSSK